MGYTMKTRIKYIEGYGYTPQFFRKGLLWGKWVSIREVSPSDWRGCEDPNVILNSYMYASKHGAEVALTKFKIYLTS